MPKVILKKILSQKSRSSRTILILSMLQSTFQVLFFQNGLLNALPHLWTVIAGQIFGYASDLILAKSYMSKNCVRKIMHTFGFLMPGLGLALLGYVVDDWRISAAIMTTGYGFRGATYSGHTQVVFFPIFCLFQIKRF